MDLIFDRVSPAFNMATFQLPSRKTGACVCNAEVASRSSSYSFFRRWFSGAAVTLLLRVAVVFFFVFKPCSLTNTVPTAALPTRAKTHMLRSCSNNGHGRPYETVQHLPSLTSLCRQPRIDVFGTRSPNVRLFDDDDYC